MTTKTDELISVVACEHGYVLDAHPIGTPCGCRPVTCAVCGQQMFYDGDTRHEPELTLRKSNELKEQYAHDRCVFSLAALPAHHPATSNAIDRDAAMRAVDEAAREHLGKRCVHARPCELFLMDALASLPAVRAVDAPRTLDNLVIVDNGDPALTRALERIIEVAKAGAIQTKDQDAAERFAWIMGRARGQLLRLSSAPAVATTKMVSSMARHSFAPLGDALYCSYQQGVSDDTVCGATEFAEPHLSDDIIDDGRVPSTGQQLATPLTRFINDAERWRHDLKNAGWTAESMTTFRDPEGLLWRGPAGAWAEMQRRESPSDAIQTIDGFSDSLPLTTKRIAAGEYALMTRDGRRVGLIESASFADWLCASANGYDTMQKELASLPAVRVAEQPLRLEDLPVCLKCGHPDDTNKNGVCQTQMGSRNWAYCLCHCAFPPPATTTSPTESLCTVCSRPVGVGSCMGTESPTESARAAAEEIAVIASEDTLASRLHSVAFKERVALIVSKHCDTGAAMRWLPYDHDSAPRGVELLLKFADDPRDHHQVCVLNDKPSFWFENAPTHYILISSLQSVTLGGSGND